MDIIYFVLSFLTSVAGAISGIGGGIILKPVLDSTGIQSISTINFLSGCTVLSMTIVSLVRNKRNGVRLDFNRTVYLALGSVVGGLLGKYIFDWLKNLYSNQSVISVVQSVCLFLITLSVLFFMLFKQKVKTYDLKNKAFIAAAGLLLGFLSAFLGIGGGPMNIALLYILFSMDTKTAALNSLFIIFFSQASSLIGMAATGSMPVFKTEQLLLMISGGVCGGLVGSAISKKISEKNAGRFFTYLLYLILIINVYNIFRFIR